MRKPTILFAVSIVLSSAVFGQFPQAKTVDQKMAEKAEQIERVEAERRQMEAADGLATPNYFSAVMNVDVQLALAKQDYKNFAEAKQNATSQIFDGDPAWLFVKFNGKLDRYVYRLRDVNGDERYLIFVEYGPQGDVTAKSHSILEFSKSDLVQTELKFSLSPGKSGHNKSLAIFLKNIAVSKLGRWNNELRFANNPSFPRAASDYLAKTAFVADFSKGLAKYPAMMATFESMILRDSTDETRLPVEGKFDNTLVRTAIFQKLAGEGIAPSRVYFSGDNWLEYSDLPTSQRQFRVVTATYTYRKGLTCLYGTATIIQPYNAMVDGYAESTITLKRNLTTPCAVPKTAP